jgi:hypothetical protein
MRSKRLQRWSESNGTTLTEEEWIEELNKYDRLHQYAKKRKREESSEEKRKRSGKERWEEPKEGTTLSTEKWIETLNKHDLLEQYAKKRKRESGEQKQSRIRLAEPELH